MFTNTQLVVLSALCMLMTVVSAHEAKEEVPIKYFIFREDCFEKFFDKQDFSDQSCIKFSFSKLIGYAIITGSTILKLPQIINIVKAGSSKGVSASSYYFEMITFMNTLCYSRHLMLPLTVYGETIIILAQNAVVILLIFNYDKSIGMVEKLGFVVFFAAYSAVLLDGTMIPEHLWPMVSSSCILFNMMSRVPQIYSNFANKSTGVLAFITFFLAWAGGAARLATVLIESDDFWYRMQFIMSFALNSIIICQFGLYWNSAKGKVGADKKKNA